MIGGAFESMYQLLCQYIIIKYYREGGFNTDSLH